MLFNFKILKIKNLPKESLFEFKESLKIELLFDKFESFKIKQEKKVKKKKKFNLPFISRLINLPEPELFS